MSFLIVLMIAFLSSVSGDDRMALLEIRKSVSDPFGLLSTWNPDSSDHCSWFGVSCDSDGRVSGLIIGGNFSLSPSCSMNSELAMHGLGIRRNCSKINGILMGELSPAVGNLSQLKVLSVPFNSLRGKIPVGIWGLKNLEVLDLEGNFMDGNTSDFVFSGLKKLRILNLAFNKFFGRFPLSLSECNSLRILNFAGNKINGVVPRLIGFYQKLKVVNLSFNRLVGPLNDAFGGDCGKLEHLDLSFNFLLGEIPRALGNCSQIKSLLLSSNRFHGVIPCEFGQLQRLEILDVSRNNLSGLLPVSLRDCADLSVLVLTNHFDAFPNKRWENLHGQVPWIESNHFEGSIPEEITKLPKMKVIWAPGANLEGKFPSHWGSCESLKMENLANFFSGETTGLFAGCTDLEYHNLSSNKLKGRSVTGFPVFCLSSNNISSETIPRSDTDIRRRISTIRNAFWNPSSSYLSVFLHNTLSENDSATENKSNTGPKDDGTDRLSILITIVVIAVAVISGVIGCLFAICCAKAKRAEPNVDISSSPAARYLTVFHDIGFSLTYDRIVQATRNFSRVYCIGTGGFGSTYRAEFAPGNVVAIKRRTTISDRPQGVMQFHAEINILGRLRHPNLITLIGYYTSPTEMFLIYNYLPGGNLGQLIRDRQIRHFDWHVAHKIALSIASALFYLHEQCNPHVVHRDIKPSNILLDNDNNAYLADFGLSKFIATTQSSATTRVAGTYGYIAPEYALTGRVSRKADVYSYGLVLLELMSDKRTNDPSFCLRENGYNIVSWARMLREGNQEEDIFTAKLWDYGPRKKLLKFLEMAISCTHETVSTRPTMRQVVQRLSYLELQPS